MLTAALDHAQRETYLAQLFELLRIPSISALSQHAADCQRAADWLVADLTRMGIKQARALPTVGGHPVVCGEWLEAGPAAPTILFYGHYDVQPVDPLNLWHSPPFEPQVRAGAVYARGAGDDKGQVMLALKAVESMLTAEGALPVNIKFLIEGDEESNGEPLQRFVRENAAQLAADSVLICDTGFNAPGEPALPYSVRGIAAAEVRVSGPKTDLHSGGYGGTVRNPVGALAALIAALHDERGHVRIPGFYDAVRPLTPEEQAALATQLTVEQWQAETGVDTPWGEPEFSLAARIGARPTCEVNGIWGGFQGEGGKTIIPAEAGAKFTMRLVADQDPEDILRRFTDYILSRAPAGVRVEVIPQQGCRAAMTPIDAPEMRAAARALAAVWGKGPVFHRGGGSLPVLATLQEALNHKPIVMLGFGLPGSNAHAPNEHFELAQFYGGMETIVQYCHEVGKLR